MMQIIILSWILTGYFALRLFRLKRSIRALSSDFKEARNNLNAEQHVELTSPDRDLEEMAVQLNQYIQTYFNERYRQENALKAVGDEITCLSHDLRTPVTSILGYLDFMEEEGLTDGQEEALAVVRRKAYDLNILVEQLYEYARLENEDYPVRKEKLDLYRILREHLLGNYLDFKMKGIEPDLQLPDTEGPVWVMGDKVCVERVLSNLTSNAAKYTEGEVRVSLKCEGRYAQITYRTGRGDLTEFDIAHLFDRFYRKGQNGRTVKSSGLGLTIAKLYMERMEGSAQAWGEEDFLNIVCTLKRWEASDAQN